MEPLFLPDPICDIMTPQVKKRQEELSRALETVGEDMDRMQDILDELDKLNNQVGWGRGRCISSRAGRGV